MGETTNDNKSGDPSEWPPGLRIREVPSPNSVGSS